MAMGPAWLGGLGRLPEGLGGWGRLAMGPAWLGGLGRLPQRLGLKGWGSRVGAQGLSTKGWLKGCIGFGLRGWLNRGWLKGIA